MTGTESVFRFRKALLDLAEKALSPLEHKVLYGEVNRLVDTLLNPQNDIPLSLIHYIQTASERRRQLVLDYRALESDLATLKGAAERVERMMVFLGSITDLQMRERDRKAFKRWMDEAAVRERARCMLHHWERRTEVCIRMLCEWIAQPEQINEWPDLWKKFEIPSILMVELSDSPRFQNRRAVLNFWIRILDSVSDSNLVSIFPDFWRQRIEDITIQSDENVWIRLDAFKVLSRYNREMCLERIGDRLEQPLMTRDDRFLRAGLIRLVKARFSEGKFMRFAQKVLFRPDPSEHVRITAARTLGGSEIGTLLETVRRVVMNPDEGEKVRAAALSALQDTCKTHSDASFLCDASDVFFLCLDRSRSGFDALVAINGIIHTIHGISGDFEPGHVPGRMQDRLRKIDEIIEDVSYPPRIRRAASAVREKIILSFSSKVMELKSILEKRRSKYMESGHWFISSAEVPDRDILGRVMALVAAEDLNLSAMETSDGYRIILGDSFARKLWRILDELRHPDPSKRQGFPHCIGRKPSGTIRAPSRLLYEMTASKVPGERLFIPSDHSWRPYLPTVDDLLSLCTPQFRGKTIRIYCFEGITEISAPRGLSDRLMLWWKLTMNYRELAELRSREYSMSEDENGRTFIRTLAEDYNLSLRFKPQTYICEGISYSVMDPLIASLWKPVWNPSDPSSGGAGK